jgi:hypothetical protein
MFDTLHKLFSAWATSNLRVGPEMAAKWLRIIAPAVCATLALLCPASSPRGSSVAPDPLHHGGVGPPSLFCPSVSEHGSQKKAKAGGKRISGYNLFLGERTKELQSESSVRFRTRKLFAGAAATPY